MTYVISDIHGCYDAYIELLEIIRFSDKDTLYIVGDIYDRGDKPIEVYKDILQLSNDELIEQMEDFVDWYQVEKTQLHFL